MLCSVPPCKLVEITALNKDLGPAHNKGCVWPNQQTSSIFSQTSKVILWGYCTPNQYPHIETHLQHTIDWKGASDVLKTSWLAGPGTTNHLVGFAEDINRVSVDPCWPLCSGLNGFSLEIKFKLTLHPPQKSHSHSGPGGGPITVKGPSEKCMSNVLLWKDTMPWLSAFIYYKTGREGVGGSERV